MNREDLPLSEQLRRRSHRICALILNSDLEWIDIRIQIESMRELCHRLAPEKDELFEVVYMSRFERLWRQWRESGQEPPPAAPPPWHPDFFR